MKKTLLVAGVAAVVALAPAFAVGQPIDLQSEAPAAQFDDIRKALNTEDYAEITATDRRTVLELIDRMERQIGEREVGDLSDEHKARLFNWQDEANMILVGAAEDSRLVCRRQGTVGTRFKTTHCETVAERRRVREANQQQLRDMPRHHTLPEDRTPAAVRMMRDGYD